MDEKCATCEKPQPEGERWPSYHVISAKERYGVARKLACPDCAKKLNLPMPDNG